MLIPLIDKDPEADDFTCRDGEIDVESKLSGLRQIWMAKEYSHGANGLLPIGTYPTANIRIALQSGDKEKVNLLLGGEISRVDPATAERLTQAILQKAAESLLDISTDLRRQGLFILPFRFFTMTMTMDGTLSYPSPQAIALPTDFPPHPEITAAGVTDDALTLAIRFPVRPHRLTILQAEDDPEDHFLRTFISYPLYIPDPKEIRGSIGSVRSATGGNATGIRFAFLSSSAIKASVAAPEKYYELVGNQRTGYRLSSKATGIPDYSCYAKTCGYVPPFPEETMKALGDCIAADTDPMDWIADWQKADDGYLPISVPFIYRSGEDNSDSVALPDEAFKEEILKVAEDFDMPYILLTRPMAFAPDSRSRRNAEPRAIHSIQVHGLPDKSAIGILYGSNDCSHWQALRRFNPCCRTVILTPPRFWWRLLLLSHPHNSPLAIELQIQPYKS